MNRICLPILNIGIKGINIPYGPELHVDANAASDPNGNEADATTGWTPTGLSGTGANVFESQSGTKDVGSYALHANANDTPTSGAKFEKLWSGLDVGATYRLSFRWRHVGTGLTWKIYVNGGGGPVLLGSVTNTDITFATITHDELLTNASLNVFCIESNGSNNGGVFIDNISLKKIL